VVADRSIDGRGEVARGRWSIRIAAVAAAYVSTGLLGLALPYVGSNITLVWPPTGIAVAALVRWRGRAAAGVAIGAFVVNLIIDASPLQAAAIALGNTLGPLVAMHLLDRAGFDPRFARQRDVLGFGVVVPLAMTVTATAGTAALLGLGGLPWSEAAAAWLAWWLGDTVGALVVGPLLLTAPDAAHLARPPRPGRRARLLEIVLVWIATGALSVLVLFRDVPMPMTFAVQVPLIWAALRFRTWQTTVTTLMVAGLAVVATAAGHGPFAHADSESNLIQLATFVGAASLLSLLVHAVLAERDAAAATLHENQRRLQAALSAGEMGTWTWDIPAGAVAWDDSAAALVGRGPVRETPVDGLVEGVHPDDRGLVSSLLDGARRGEIEYEVEYRIVRPDGQTRWLAARGRLERDAAGAPSSLAIAAIDITERRQAEERRQDAERSAFETEARMGAIVNAAMEAIITIDAAARVVVFNAAAERMLRVRAPDILGRHVEDIVPAEHRGDARGWLGRLLGPRRPGGGGGDGDVEASPSTPIAVTAIRADGVPLPVEASVSQLGTGADRLVTIILRDVSERLRGERERERLEGELHQAQKMEAIGTLAGGIAHDFNNLLAAILGNAELVQLDLPAGHPSRPAVDDIVTVGLRARDLVRQILAFGRRHDLQHRQQVRVDYVMTEAFRVLRSTLPASIELVRRVPDEPVTVLGDSAQLHQVLLNLCTNAAQAMPPGGGRIEVAAELVDVDGAMALTLVGLEPGRHVRISVIDTGAGMDAATRERIFEPFFTTKPPGQGTGLGLAVVHGIVRGHGGAVTVDSAPGAGTTVRVYLPAVQAAAPDVTEPSLVPAAPVGRGEHVLWIDDEPMVAAVGKRRLERLGYRVTAVTSPAAALDLLRTTPDRVDLVITDLTMPGLTGLDLAARLADTQPELPVLLSTGNDADVPGAGERPANIRDVLQKPTPEVVLARAVRLALGDRATS
jgi:PAS domain S-box-containing protein